MDIGSISAFAGYEVQIKTGNCTVDKSDWNRNDFPFWKYFDEATNAESLNNWKAKGKDTLESSAYSQNGAKSIGDSKVTILMPESLKKKMEMDSEYADKIMEKVGTWKKNYDLQDIAIAQSLGESPSISKMALQQGSYLIELDENGDIENYTVTTSNLGFSSEQNQKTNNENKEIKKLPVVDKKIKGIKKEDSQFSMNVEPDYLQAMEIMSCSVLRKI